MFHYMRPGLIDPIGEAPFVGAFSYSNIYGQGDRTAAGIIISSSMSGTHSTLINGSGADTSCKMSATTGQFIEFLFPTEIEMDQFTWDQGSNITHNTWKAEVKRGAGAFITVNAGWVWAATTAGTINLAPTPRMDRLRFSQVSGTANTTPFIQEFTFRTRNA